MRESYITKREGKPADNYELTCEKWRKLFLEMNHEELVKRFQLKSDENAVYIVYYGQEYRIDRINGMITLTLEPEQKLFLIR